MNDEVHVENFLENSDEQTDNLESNVPEEEDVCRICRSPEGVLLHPCKCAGSIKYVHETCLMDWIKQSKKTKCELCNHEFAFSSEYSPEAPKVLSFFQFFVGVFIMMKNVISKICRIGIVSFVWLAAIPLLTVMLLRMCLANSMTEIKSSLQFENFIFQDISMGLAMTLGVFFSVMGFGVLLQALNEFFNNNPGLLGEEEDENNIQEEEEEEEEVDNIVPQENIQINFENPNINLDNDDVDIEQAIGLKGPISIFVQNSLTMLLTNSVSLILFAFVPYNFGKILNYLLFNFDINSISNSVSVQKTSLIGIGYIAEIWVVVVFVLFANIALPDNQELKSLTNFIKFIYSFFKVIIFTALHFICIPFFIGCVADYFTMDFFGSSLDDRIAYFKVETSSGFIIHQSLGVIFLILLSLTVKTLREFLRPTVLWFLNNPDENEFSFVREIIKNKLVTQVRRMTMTCIFFTLIILGVVRTPLKLSKIIAPKFFPLKVGFQNPIFQIAIDMMILLLSTQIGLDRLRPRLFFKSFYMKWIEIVGGQLGLKNYFLPGEPEIRKSNFLIKILLFGVITLAAIVIIVTTFILVPLSVGKGFLSLLQFDFPNDLYVHILGCYMIGGSTFGTYTIITQLRQRFFTQSLSIFIKWTIWFAKFIGLSFIWFGILPLLLGLSFELVCIFPLYYNMEKTAPIIWNEMWVFGLFYLGTYSRLVMVLPLEEFTEMKHEFDIIKRNGIFNFDALRILKKIIFPFVYQLTLFILLPYIVCYGIIGNFMEISYYDLSYAYTFSYPILFCLLFGLFLLKKFVQWIQKLHTIVKDDQFLVQRRIVNLE
eukprot:gene743-8995_t